MGKTMVSGFNVPFNQSTEWNFGEANFHAHPFFGVFLPAGLPGPPGCFFGAWNWDNLMYLSRRFALCRTGPENGAPAIPTKIDQWLSSFHRHMSSFYDHFPQLTWQKMWAL